MIKKLSVLSVLLLAIPLVAQTAAPAAPKAEELTTLEKAGLSLVLKNYQQVLSDLSQANIDIAKSHPGYHLDPKNPFSGSLVKDEAKKESPKDAPKESPKPVEKK